jgi:threonine/homoserine/homoserine lactone efflux protein
MSLDNQLLLFLTASLVVIVAPGPDNILVLTRGITLGRGAAMVSAAGAGVGLVCHSIFAAVGLSALLAQSVVAFSVVKYVGAAYLIYIGIKAFLSKDTLIVLEDAPQVGLRSVFSQAVISNVLNPKIAIFFLAYLPQFANQSASGLQLLTLGLVFAFLTWMIFSGLGYFSGYLGDRIFSRPVYARVLNRVTGCVLIALGLRLTLSERP